MLKSILISLFVLFAYSGVFAQGKKNTASTPIYKGCKKNVTSEEIEKCTNSKMYNFIIEKVSQYQRKEGERAGTVFINFVIDKKGNPNKVEVERGIYNAPRLDSLAIEIIRSMPRFKPGKRGRKAIEVPYKVPVRFK